MFVRSPRQEPEPYLGILVQDHRFRVLVRQKFVHTTHINMYITFTEYFL